MVILDTHITNFFIFYLHQKLSKVTNTKHYTYENEVGDAGSSDRSMATQA